MGERIVYGLVVAALLILGIAAYNQGRTAGSECSAVCRYDDDGRAESCRLHCPKWEGVCRVQMIANETEGMGFRLWGDEKDEATGLPWTFDGWSGR